MPADRTIRVGVVGIGFGQHVHVPAFRSDPRCAVVMIGARERRRAEAVADHLRIGRYTCDWREIAEDDDIDVVSIATPPRVQSEIALAALSRGKAVFCEKPLAASTSDAECMVQAAALAEVPNAVDFEFPEIATWKDAKSLLPEIGRLSHASINWHVQTYANRRKLDSWKTRSEEGGGALYSFVSHVFYYLEWLLGPIERLSARLSRAPGDPGTGDSFAALLVDLASGPAISLSVSTNAYHGSGHRIELYGESGSLILENASTDYIAGFRLLFAERGSDVWRTVQDESSLESGQLDARVSAVKPLIHRFLDWVDDGNASKPDFADGLRVQRLLEAAVQSHHSGSFVAVRP